MNNERKLEVTNPTTNKENPIRVLSIESTSNNPKTFYENVYEAFD